MFSLLTALAVAYIGVRNSRSTEVSRVRVSYFNYALQQIMDEYVKYNPVIDITNVTKDTYFQEISSKFKECKESIRKVRPLIEENYLQPLAR
jgi:hypothetical protein